MRSRSFSYCVEPIMTDARIALTTAGSKQEADRLALEFVERRLAACVNVVGPIQSSYRWQGKVESAEEFLLLIKTTAQQVDALQRAIRELHSYELPEFIVLSVDEGSREYLAWIADSVQPTRSHPEEGFSPTKDL